MRPLSKILPHATQYRPLLSGVRLLLLLASNYSRRIGSQRRIPSFGAPYPPCLWGKMDFWNGTPPLIQPSSADGRCIQHSHSGTIVLKSLPLRGLPNGNQIGSCRNGSIARYRQSFELDGSRAPACRELLENEERRNLAVRRRRLVQLGEDFPEQLITWRSMQVAARGFVVAIVGEL